VKFFIYVIVYAIALLATQEAVFRAARYFRQDNHTRWDAGTVASFVMFSAMTVYFTIKALP
jgi:hypothetical protein